MYTVVCLSRMYKALGSIHITRARDGRKLMFLNSYSQIMALQKNRKILKTKKKAMKSYIICTTDNHCYHLSKTGLISHSPVEKREE